MLVKDAMLDDPLVVTSDTKVHDFIEAVVATNQTTGVVVDNGQLVGVVSAHDIYRGLLPHFADLDSRLARLIHDTHFDDGLAILRDHPVSGIMSKAKLQTCKPTDSIMRAIEVFVHKGFNTLPVVDGARYVGSVSRRSVLSNFQKRQKPPEN